MKKIVTIMLIFAITFTLCACGSKDADKPKEEPVAEGEAEEAEAEEETTEPEAEEETEETSEADNDGTFLKNDTKLFPGAESLAEVKMGVTEGGEKVQFCTVKGPATINYGFNTMYIDEDGKEQNDDLPNFLDEAYEYMDDYLASRVGFAGDGLWLDVHIVSTEVGSIAKGKEVYPGGYEVSIENGKTAYISEFVQETNRVDKYVMYIIDLNDNWTLFVQYGGKEELEFSLDEYADELAKVITLVD